MLEITIDNCQKCDLEAIIDANNSQYFRVNRRDLEIGSKRNWQFIFNKWQGSWRQKYRNDLFEKIIKSCKATNLEYLKLKEKLGLCLYEVICDEQEFISTSEEIFQGEKNFAQHNLENKQLKEENEQLRKENEQLRKNNVVKDAEIKESIEKPKEIKSPEEDKNTTDSYPNWFDKNKFKNILAIIDSNKFNYKNKIGEFKYTDIKDLVDNIKNNTISEIDAKKLLNALNEIKKAEIIKYKKCTPGEKELLNLFVDLFDIISTDKTLESESQDENEYEKVESRKEENEYKYEYEDEYENEDDDEYENEDDDETLSQNKIN